jgi:hypothetical protein
MGTTETVARASRVQFTGPSIEQPVRLSKKSEFLSLDEELQQWKLARRRNFEIPWRPLSLMATLCFGIASFVLPDSVNDNYNGCFMLWRRACMRAFVNVASTPRADLKDRLSALRGEAGVAILDRDVA